MLGRDGSGYLSLPVDPMKIAPVVLEGRVVWLEPLRLSHLTALCEVGLDEDLWHFMPDGIKRTPADMEQFIATALDQQALGTALPLAIIERDSGQAIGSTRFLNIKRNHHTIEIGAT